VHADGRPPARLRSVGPQDWATWRDLRVEALRDTPLGFVQTLEHALAQDAAAWRQRMADVPCNVLAEAGGRAVAMASGFLVEQQPFLGAVYVTPAWRGRGLLAALVDAVAQWARPLAPELLLEVHEDNARARRAYQGLGFVETGRAHPYPLEPGGLELVMARAL
jgi:GNAT superfamily N-acetyltransferase